MRLNNQAAPRPVPSAWRVGLLATCLAAFPLARAFAQAPPAPQAPFVVVLDAAHGGDDPGGHSGGWTEKSSTLALSVRLRSLLMARGIPVVTTRESDTNVDDQQRAAIANHAAAAACLSLHASLSGGGNQPTIHLFVSSLKPARAVRFAPWRAAQSVAVSRSLALAGVLNAALEQAGVTVTLGRTELAEIESMTCPAVAVEVAPDHSRGQSATDSLSDPGYQAHLAEALAAALLEWRTEKSHLGAGPP
jgi:N-acetylmuramoyl-L-alanine amidase